MFELTAPGPAPIHLPRSIQQRLDAFAAPYMNPKELGFDFLAPDGEAALLPTRSVTWHLFKNPVSLFVGGVAAVILELAEPRVRSGVWDHTSFRTDPATRIRRTGLAAMATVYGARSRAEAMIAGVRRAHGRVTGVTPDGKAYAASDPDLLNWVQATASFGFVTAYDQFVRRLSPGEMDEAYFEARVPARLYGADRTPECAVEMHAYLEGMLPSLEPSAILLEFLDVMMTSPILPPALRPVQRLLVRAAVSTTPEWAQEILRIRDFGLRRGERFLVRQAGGVADRILLESSPPVQACRRLGLPKDYLYGAPVRPS
jgi:uncharacterized protein (DUF2236 family)